MQVNLRKEHICPSIHPSIHPFIRPSGTLKPRISFHFVVSFEQENLQVSMLEIACGDGGEEFKV